MYLKNLEIRGFKSFADKTQLEFRSGITAVVGPNGSGKSNISDAVRWVLGEQSVKQLRGGKMEDVIFAGTLYRKPVGQASVSLTLDNSCHTLPVAYNEVTVTRRLYRSGESEYLINNNPVRLRDIHELFMDTGIGREGYSMIGQGKIDAILSGKPEERRGLVEEAAGITKYKARKEEGEKKLRNAQDNLDRVEDILSTYEERIGPLKLDKQKAEIFLELSGEMKDLQISVILTELEEMESKNEGLITSHADLTTAFSELTTQKLKAEHTSTALADDLQATADEKSRTREAYYENKGTADELSSQIALIEEKARSLEDRIASIGIMTEELTGQLEQNSREEQTAILTKAEALASYQRAQADYGTLLEEFQGFDQTIRDSGTRSNELKTREEALRRELSDHKDQLAKAQADLQYLAAKTESIRNLSQNYEAALALNQEGAAKLTVELEKVLTQKSLLKKNLNELQTQLVEHQKTAESKSGALETLRRTIRDGEGRAALLKSLEESHEGYAKSVRDLFSFLKRTNSPILSDADILGDVLTTKPDYSIAIEAALGGYVGNIITKTDDQAKALIEILKKQKLGRCTFLPRNVIKATRIKLPVFKTVKVLGLASDLVETPAGFREIIDSILARTIIVKTMDDAVLAARETGHRIKIVTLEGDIILGGGAMTGGSQKGQASGVVSRRAELDGLAQMLEANRIKYQQVKTELDQIKDELDHQKYTVSDHREALRLAELEETKFNERISSFGREVDRIIDLMNSQGQEGSGLVNEMDRASRSLHDIEGTITQTEQDLKAVQQAIATVRDLRRDLFDQNDRLKDVLSDQRVKVTQTQRDLAGINQALERIQTSRTEVEGRIAALLSEVAGHTAQIKDHETTTKSMTAQRLELQALMAQQDQRTDELDQAEFMIRSKIRESAQYLETVRSEYYRLEKELLRVTLNLEKYEEEKTELLTKLNEDLDLSLAEAKDLRQPLESKAKAKKRISEIRSKISGLGNVNLSAIEEYKKVSEHYEFLSSQKNDLLRSKEELMKLITEMTSKMRALFNENFVILSRNFKETFRQLFNGGTGELIMAEGDVLSGNIDINVQPPGKKLQNINLLSGGEKVLSAIALTFAILRMKPSPFCFLDEIEAALDDANVYRYANFVKEFAKDTQFILITHRKGTMEAANILYGVTMEEKGISKIVSVDLDHMKEESI